MSFSKLSFKVESVYMLPQCSDMLNKNTLDVKSARPIRSSPTYVRLKSLILAEAKKSPIKDILNYLNDIRTIVPNLL